MKILGTVGLLLTAVTGIAGNVWPEATREARPWAYNWWMGSAVDEAGLKLQCDEMAKVGFGGFHVIPIYSVQKNPNDKPLLSKEWMDAFGTAVRLANAKGLGVDLTTGSGWCFGGPQLKPEEGSWIIEVNSKKLDKATVLWKGTGKDGTKVVLSVRPTGQQVKRSGPGAHGPMMNPLSASAMASFLKPFTAAFDQPGAAKPEHMYHDSYEYYGAGWSKELPEAFAKRRGYRLEDHYAEFAGVGDKDAIARVKCDYRETLSEMMVEDVFSQWTDWCKARGIGTRNEAHGAPANWLDFYALADIPETEMFSCEKRFAQHPRVNASFINSGDRDIVVSKFASSAAHVKHLGAAKDPLVGSESCTWVSEHFCETPGAVKTFIDRLFLSGVNHMFYHGMCYSPADAKWPGWTFYASCEMNRFNPLWQSADVLNAYITRVQSVAQDAAIDNDILVYWPLDDYWMNAEGYEKQMSVHARDWLAGQPIGAVSRRLWDEGYAFDFVSEKQLRGLPTTCGAGRDGTRPGSGLGNRYTTIVVPGAKAMKPETFARFVELAKGGWTVLFVGGFPKTVPGWKDVAKREAELKKLEEAARGGDAAWRPRLQEGPYDELMAKAPVRREPFNKAAGLMYTRHAKPGEVTYFIANQYVDKGVQGRFKPASPCKSALLRDPMTGEAKTLEVKDGAVEIALPIGASVLLTVYSEEKVVRAGEDACSTGGSRRDACSTGEIALDGEWTRTPVFGGPEMPAVKTGKLPMPWGKTGAFPECAFSGTMRYETTFEIGRDGTRPLSGLEIDLGKVASAAKVYVNGTYAGAAIMAPYRVKIPAALVKAGKNTLAVDVTGSGANRLKWLDTAKPYAWKIFTDINMVDINYLKFDASKWAQQESGLYGPVALTGRTALATRCASSASPRQIPVVGPYQAGGVVTEKAPWGEVVVNVPTFREAAFSIADFGGDVNKAMAACAKAGGGRVVVPAGKWLMKGPVHFKSNCLLWLDEGAELQFSDNPKDYLPAVHTTWEGSECMNYSPLIYAYECENVGIAGKGTIRAIKKGWNPWNARPPAHMKMTENLYYWMSTNAPVALRDVTKENGNFRPHLIQFNRSKNILLKDFTIRDSPFWTEHLYLCRSVLMEGIDSYAHGHNNDGIDVEMTQDVIIRNCRFDQGDDGIVLKSGRNQDGWRLRTPTKNVVVRDCTLVDGHGLLVIGSEMAGGVENVYMHDSRAVGQDLLRMFYLKTNERRGGALKHITMERCTAENVKFDVFGIATDILYQWAKLPTFEVRVTEIDDINMIDCDVKSAERAYKIVGDSRRPIGHVHLKNVKVVAAKKDPVAQNVTNLTCD